MRADDWAVVRLFDAGAAEYRYRFEYHGRQLVDLSGAPSPVAVSEVSGWLPTEFLEEQGPARVRELALDMAGSLPFCSGHVGLSFNGGARSGRRQKRSHQAVLSLPRHRRP
ncbi:DUF3396 domain-containing protein [Stigmatella sp. ncwal1]|uniref:DUF3396 domain-containing protein n=2 Tax=Stigmatella ashevillensis TaxID=2995309 RepID=A0ABT5DAP1_9BACT|nr:DUF3396 domain-containing protein [Stigmatella ashevillena]